MLPVLEIFTLFEVFVKPVQLVLLVLTAMICVVSGVSILVSIYNSMAGRRHEIAVMRALGASRDGRVVDRVGRVDHSWLSAAVPSVGSWATV